MIIKLNCHLIATDVMQKPKVTVEYLIVLVSL